MAGDLAQAAEDYARIAQAIRFLDDHAAEQPGLSDVAGYLDLSPGHLQRLFSRWVGISPKRFLQYLTKERASGLLAGSASVLEATYEVGLSGPGRLHDLFVNCEAVTPGEYKQGGQDLEIRWGFHPTPFGEGLVGLTDRGICWLSFVGPRSRSACLDRLKESWSRASFREETADTGRAMGRIFSGFGPDARPGEDRRSSVDGQPGQDPLHLLVKGTNFQIKVWEALLKVPFGRVTTYGALARAVGHPEAQRAVGNAVGKNPVAFLIPCHRVIRSSGAFGNYQGGPDRKRLMLAWETAGVEG